MHPYTGKPDEKGKPGKKNEKAPISVCPTIHDHGGQTEITVQRDWETIESRVNNLKK
jgi:hypothetical protein